MLRDYWRTNTRDNNNSRNNRKNNHQIKKTTEVNKEQKGNVKNGKQDEISKINGRFWHTFGFSFTL